MSPDGNANGVQGRCYAEARREKPYLIFRYRMRARIVADAAGRYLKETAGPFRILDLGSAEGLTLMELRSLLPNGKYVGVECSDELLQCVPEVSSDTRIIKGDVTNLPETIENGSYDIVSALALLEHLSTPFEAVREAARALRPGGIFVATCPVPLWDALATTFGVRKQETHHITAMNRKLMIRSVEEASLQLLAYERILWAPIAALPYLGVRVSPSFSLSLDRTLRHARVLDWSFVNHCVIARKPS